ncbi:MAG: hypothetical protein NTW79_04455 [Candidatus Berkelbacteria bacterium]|nr:hypothetical protein [Candidatus Berkelbacteria bacterium]
MGNFAVYIFVYFWTGKISGKKKYREKYAGNLEENNLGDFLRVQEKIIEREFLHI